jgi:hypothetical protein
MKGLHGFPIQPAAIQPLQPIQQIPERLQPTTWRQGLIGLARIIDEELHIRFIQRYSNVPNRTRMNRVDDRLARFDMESISGRETAKKPVSLPRSSTAGSWKD